MTKLTGSGEIAGTITLFINLSSIDQFALGKVGNVPTLLR